MAVEGKTKRGLDNHKGSSGSRQGMRLLPGAGARVSAHTRCPEEEHGGPCVSPPGLDKVEILKEQLWSEGSGDGYPKVCLPVCLLPRLLIGELPPCPLPPARRGPAGPPQHS